MYRVNTAIVGSTATALAIAAKILEGDPNHTILMAINEDRDTCRFNHGLASAAFTNEKNVEVAMLNNRILIELASKFRIKRILKHNRMFFGIMDDEAARELDTLTRTVWKKFNLDGKTMEPKDIGSKWNINSDSDYLRDYIIVSAPSISYYRCVFLKEMLLGAIEKAGGNIIRANMKELKVKEDDVELLVEDGKRVYPDNIVIADEVEGARVLSDLGYEEFLDIFERPRLVTEPVEAQRIPNLYLQNYAILNYTSTAELVLDLINLYTWSGAEDTILRDMQKVKEALEVLSDIIPFLSSIRFIGITKEKGCKSMDGSPVTYSIETRNGTKLYITCCYGGREDSMYLVLSNSIASIITGKQDEHRRRGIDYTKYFDLYRIERFKKGDLLTEKLVFA